MDFDFKKARKDKQKQDKARSTHRQHPDRNKQNPNRMVKHSSDGGYSGVKCHSTPLNTKEKPTSYTETNPALFEHLKRETEDITDVTEKKSFSRRVIVSNWERYELPPDTPNEQPGEALDFETLINSLSGVTGHLRLSHEQDWGNERSELQEVFFNIDMNKLFASLERVPFQLRQNLPRLMFTMEQLAVFQQDADEAQKQSGFSKVIPKEDIFCQKVSIVQAGVSSTTRVQSSNHIKSKPLVAEGILDNSVNQPNNEISPAKTVCQSKSSQMPDEIFQATDTTEDTAESAVNVKCEELDLDFLLSLDTAVPDKPKLLQQVDVLTRSPATASKNSEKERLDDWLDNILDD